MSTSTCLQLCTGVRARARLAHRTWRPTTVRSSSERPCAGARRARSSRARRSARRASARRSRAGGQGSRRLQRPSWRRPRPHEMAPLLSKSHSAYRADVLLRWLDRGGEQFDYLVSPRVSGTEFASTDRSGRLRVTIEAVPALCCGEDGWLHPGAVAQLVDTFTSHAIVVAGGFPGVTISMAMHYTRKNSKIIVDNTVVKLGRRVAFTRAEIKTLDENGNEVLCAVGTHDKFVQPAGIVGVVFPWLPYAQWFEKFMVEELFFKGGSKVLSGVAILDDKEAKRRAKESGEAGNALASFQAALGGPFKFETTHGGGGAQGASAVTEFTVARRQCNLWSTFHGGAIGGAMVEAARAAAGKPVRVLSLNVCTMSAVQQGKKVQVRCAVHPSGGDGGEMVADALMVIAGRSFDKPNATGKLILAPC